MVFLLFVLLTLAMTLPFDLDISIARHNSGNPTKFYFYLRSALGLILSVGLLIWYPKQLLSLVAQNVFLLALVAFDLLSGLWSASPYMTIRGEYVLLSCLLFSYALNIRFDLKGVASIVLHALGLAAIASVIWVAVFPDVAVHGADDLVQGGHEGMWRGVYRHKNILGVLAGVAMPLLLGPGRALIQGRLVYVSYLVATTMCLIGAASGSGVVIGAFGLLFVAAFSMPSRTGRVGIALLYLSLGIVGVTFSDDLIGPVLNLLDKDPTLTGRTALWEAAWGLIRERPLMGHGYPSASDPGVIAVFESMNHVPNAHNAYLQLLIESGCVGLTLWTLSIAIGLRALFHEMVSAKMAPEVVFFGVLSLMLLFYGASETAAMDISNCVGILWVISVVSLSSCVATRARRVGTANRGGAMRLGAMCPGSFDD